MPSPGYIQQNVISPQVFGGRAFEEPIQWQEAVANNASWAGTQIGANTLLINPFTLPIPIGCTAFDIFVSNSYSATNAGSSRADTVSVSAGIYTKNASSLSLIGSASVSYAFTVTGSSSSISYQAMKNLTIPWNAFLYEGNYWIGVISAVSTAGNAIAGALSNVVASHGGGFSNYSGQFGQSSANSNSPLLGHGILSVTTSAVPNSIAFSDISGNAAVGNTGRLLFNFKNYSA